MNRPLLPVLFSMLGAVAIATAQTPVLDINTTPSGYDSNVNGGRQSINNDFPQDSFAQLGGNWYFTAQILGLGDELWRTDGTAAGTAIVRDINPGGGSSNVTWITPFGAKVFFTATDGVNGTELWCTDGTTIGTVMVKDINPGAGNSNPAQLTVWNGLLWFSADNGVNGTELWSSDGTAAGTNLFVELRVGASSIPTNLIPSPSGTTLLFRANDGTTGTELWSTDGTVAGTALLADINTGTASSSPSGFVEMGGRLYFSASNVANGLELWSTDGTNAGTTLVKDINTGSASSSPNLAYATVYLGELYFAATTAANGTEVWKTDGTAAGTVMVWDVTVGTGSSSPSDFHVLGADLYFTADDTTIVGRELRRISPGGVQAAIGDIRSGSADAFLFSANNLFPHNGKLFFKANDGSTGTELGVSDGTPGGTFILADLDPGTAGTDPDWFTPINATQVIFVADTVATGQELWITDGTPGGTGLLVEIDATILTADSQPEDLISFNGKSLFFAARTPLEGEELWKWDPVAGASMVLDIRPGTAGSAPTSFTYGWLNGADRLLFTANDGVNGVELWTTDGTAAGTVMVKDIFPGVSSGSPAGMTYWNGRVYFSAFDGVNGSELWATDGTTAGTVLVKDIQVGANSSAPAIFCEYNGLLYFRANEGGTGFTGTELWVTDGTAAGTQLVKDIRSGSAASTPNFLTSFNGKLVFTATDGVTGTELWMSDGTAAGTVLVADIAVGTFGSAPDGLVVHNGELFFRADENGPIGRELFKTDLVTITAFDLNPGVNDSNPSFMTSIGNRLWFNATNGVAGLEPWTSDGTLAGTTMLADLNPGAVASSPNNFTSARGGAYFSATEASTGNELWFSDGTPAGTTIISDINIGTASSSPAFFTLASGRLMFQAIDAVIGKELFEINPTQPYARSVGHSGDGSTFTCDAPFLGQAWTWSWRNAPLTINIHALGDPLDSGSNLFMGGGSSSWIDLTSPSLLTLEWSVAPNGTGGLLIPNDPFLLGARVNVQSFSLSPVLLPLGSSNAMSIVVGN